MPLRTRTAFERGALAGGTSNARFQCLRHVIRTLEGAAVSKDLRTRCQGRLHAWQTSWPRRRPVQIW